MRVTRTSPPLRPLPVADARDRRDDRQRDEQARAERYDWLEAEWQRLFGAAEVERRAS